MSPFSPSEDVGSEEETVIAFCFVASPSYTHFAEGYCVSVDEEESDVTLLDVCSKATGASSIKYRVLASGEAGISLSSVRCTCFEVAICAGVRYCVSETGIFSVPATVDFCESWSMSLYVTLISSYCS